MNNLYVNFNCLRVECKFCNSNLSDNTLKKLSKQILYESMNLEDGSTLSLDYAFQCEKCKKLMSCKLYVERQKSILIVE